MTETITNPHDKYFREMFSRKDVARDFAQHYLPKEVVQHLDLSRFEISKDSFVDPALAEHFSDILYHVGLRQSETAYIYLLFDHKSYSDALVSFQLLKYKTQIWEMTLKQRQADASQKGKPIRFPPIFPLVVYHGETGWTASRKFIDLFDVPAGLERYIPNFEYWLCDLTAYSDEEIIGEALLQICLRVLKYSRANDIADHLPEIFRLFEEISNQPTALAVLSTALRYLSNSSEVLTKETLTQIVEDLFEQGGNTMATIAQTLRDEGEQVGWQKGEAVRAEAERKMREAEQKAQALAIKTIRQTLVIRFSTRLEQYDEQLNHLDLPALETLNDVMFSAQSLVEFETELARLASSKANTEAGSRKSQ